MNHFNSFFTDLKQIQLIRIASYILCFYFLAPRLFFSYPGLSLDPSYMLALDYLSSHDYTFGTDIIFTFGPLHFLNTGLCFSKIHRLLIILFELFIVLSLTNISVRLITESFLNKKYIFFALLLLSIIIFPITSFPNLALALIYFNSTSIFLFQRKGIHLFQACIIVFLSFFIKVNTSFTLIIHLIIFLTAILIVEKNKNIVHKYFISLGSLILFIPLFSYLLNVSLKDYLINSFEIIKGYNETMVYPTDSYQIIWAAINLILVFCYLLFNDWKDLKQPFYYLLSIFSIFFGIFIYYKQAFIRADSDHVLTFFTFVFILLIFTLQKDIIIGASKNKSILLNFISISFLSWFVVHTNNGVLANINHKIRYLPFHQILFWDDKIFDEEYEKSASARILPESILNTIGNKSIDIFPWEQSFLIYNNLNYRPRPVFQSYAAYTPELDKKNAVFLKSKYSPEYLLFSNHSIDTRNPFWEETHTKLAINNNYDVIDSIVCDTNIIKKFYPAESPQRILLLRKKTKPESKLSLVKKETKSFPSNHKIKLPLTDNLLFFRINIKPNFIGSFRGWVFQPVIFEAQLLVNGKWTKKYRVFPSTFSEGILINKLIIDTESSKKFFNGNIDEIANIQEVRFCFDEIIRYTIIPESYTLEEYSYR